MTPKVIETNEEYEQTLAVVESLAFKQNKTAEQTALYRLLALLVEAYEAEYYSVSEASPADVLNHILEASDTKPSDLVGLIGSITVVSEIVNGTRAINEAIASKFHPVYLLSK